METNGTTKSPVEDWGVAMDGRCEPAADLAGVVSSPVARLAANETGDGDLGIGTIWGAL